MRDTWFPAWRRALRRCPAILAAWRSCEMFFIFPLSRCCRLENPCLCISRSGVARTLKARLSRSTWSSAAWSMTVSPAFAHSPGLVSEARTTLQRLQPAGAVMTRGARSHRFRPGPMTCGLPAAGTAIGPEEFPVERSGHRAARAGWSCDFARACGSASIVL